MANETATPTTARGAAEILENSERLEAELRAGAISEIRDNIREFLDWQPQADTAQILMLRDILMWTNSHDHNVLSGVAVALNREDPNAVFVSYDHLESVEKFIGMLPDLNRHNKNPEWEQRMALIERVIEIEKLDLFHVTFDEFNALKRHLAIMRGHLPVPDAYQQLPTDAAILFERGRRLAKESTSA